MNGLVINTWVFASLSEPARSTRFNLDKVYLSLDEEIDLLSTLIVNIQWDLELSLFKMWAPIDLFVSPFMVKLNYLLKTNFLIKCE